MATLGSRQRSVIDKQLDQFARRLFYKCKAPEDAAQEFRLRLLRETPKIWESFLASLGPDLCPRLFSELLDDVSTTDGMISHDHFYFVTGHYLPRPGKSCLKTILGWAKQRANRDVAAQPATNSTDEATHNDSHIEVDRPHLAKQVIKRIHKHLKTSDPLLFKTFMVKWMVSKGYTATDACKKRQLSRRTYNDKQHELKDVAKQILSQLDEEVSDDQ